MLNDINYTNVRVYEFLKMFGYVKKWVENPWSSIKGLLCNLIGFVIPCTLVASSFTQEHT